MLVLLLGFAGLAAAAQPYFHHSTSRKYPVKGIGVIRSFNGVTGEGGPVNGVIVFTQTTPSSPVTISGQISGLKPGLHGFHIHQMGNLTEGCASLGGHFNPEGHTHGGPTYYYRHVGDLGNVDAASDGVASIYIIDSRISLTGRNGILGRGLVIHADKDDLGKGGDRESLKTGNAGSRVGCGIIGLSMEQPEATPFRPVLLSPASFSFGFPNGVAGFPSPPTPFRFAKEGTGRQPNRFGFPSSEGSQPGLFGLPTPQQYFQQQQKPYRSQPPSQPLARRFEGYPGLFERQRSQNPIAVLLSRLQRRSGQSSNPWLTVRASTA